MPVDVQIAVRLQVSFGPERERNTAFDEARTCYVDWDGLVPTVSRG